MWSRADLKQRAKDVLRKDYWKAFLISLVLSFAIGEGIGSSGGFSYNFRFNRNDKPFRFSQFKDFNWEIALSLLIVIMIIAFIVILVASAMRIFLGYPLEIGARRYFIRTAEGLEAKDYFNFTFRSSNYMKIVLTMLLKNVQLFLWTLLLIIPGIIKSYSYRIVPYILAENPEIGAKRAIQLSRQMTKGNKLDMFILDLSFIGWSLLGVMVCCIGIIFVRPYINMTMAELYLDLRKQAFETGICEPEELGMIRVEA